MQRELVLKLTIQKQNPCYILANSLFTSSAEVILYFRFYFHRLKSTYALPWTINL